MVQTIFGPGKLQRACRVQFVRTSTLMVSHETSKLHVVPNSFDTASMVQQETSKRQVPGKLVEACRVQSLFEPLVSCLSLVEPRLPVQICLVPRVTCLPVAHEHLPPGRCWMPCQICLGLPAARLNPANLLRSLQSLFTDPAYHEASPIMI